MTEVRRNPQDPMQTIWVLLAVLCRTSMVAIGVVGVTMDALRTPAFAEPFVVHAALIACDCFTVVAPLLRQRWLPLTAGVLTMLAHFAVSYGHHASVWDPWYLGIAVLFLLVPRAAIPSGRPADSQMRTRIG